jgi:hypothetical protein
MLVSLVEKVGGEKLKWSGGGDHTNAKSRPKQHLARFYDVSIDFEEHVFILVPPKVHVPQNHLLPKDSRSHTVGFFLHPFPTS